MSLIQLLPSLPTLFVPVIFVSRYSRPPSLHFPDKYTLEFMHLGQFFADNTERGTLLCEITQVGFYGFPCQNTSYRQYQEWTTTSG